MHHDLVATPQPHEVSALEKSVSFAIETATSQGASAVEVSANIDAGFSLTVRNQDLETLEHHRDKSLSLTVYLGQSKGSVSITDLSQDAVKEAVTYACHLAKYAENDPHAGLPEHNLLAFDYPDLDLHHPSSLNVEKASLIAKRAEHAALQIDPRIKNSEGATVDSFAGYQLLANSDGFMGGYWSSQHSLSTSVIAKDGDSMERDHDYVSSRLPDIFEYPEKIGEKAAQRALARLNARKIKTQNVPVLYQSDIASSLLGNFFSAISGSHQYRETSFLLGKKGESVMPSHMNIFEYPHLPQASGSSPFDEEGVKTSDKMWVKDGVLQNYVLSSYSARKLGLQTTGNAGGLHNIRLNTSDFSFEDLLKKMHRGVLITELLGQGVNIVTGDYSRGFAGFWVDQGQIQYPLHEMTLAGHLKDMLKNIVLIGKDLETRGSIWTGSILLEQMTIAGA